MRLPWQRAEDDNVRDDDDQEDLLQDQDETGDEETEEEEVSAETQALIDKARQEERQRVNDAAARRGLTFTGDDFGVTDYGRVQQSFGFQQVQQQQVQQSETSTEDVEPEFDPYDADSIRAHTAWQIRQETKSAREELQATRQMVAEERLSRAMDRVGEAVKQYAPHLAEYLDHPEFAEAFPQALSTQDPKLWGDGRTLARLVGAMSIDMDREKLPKRDTPRNERGQYTMGEQQRRQLSQVSGSRESGRVPQDEPEEIDVRQAARYLGIPPAQVRAARHTNIEDWRRERAANKEREKRR